MLDSGMLEFWDAGVLGCWSSGMLEFWDAGVLGCWSSGMLEFWDAGVLGCWSSGMLDSGMLECNCEGGEDRPDAASFGNGAAAASELRPNGSMSLHGIF